MGQIIRVGDLEISQDLDYERKSKKFRQVSAVVWAAIVVAALLGLFGTGSLSDASMSEGELEVEYERFTRFGTTTELSIESGAGEGKTNIAISRSYLAELEISDILPQPDSTTVRPDRVVYTFDVQPPTAVKFFATPREIGAQKATVWGPDGAALSYTQIVYP